VDEVPVDRRDQHWRAAPRAEIAQHRPNQDGQEHEQSHRDVHQVESGDGEIERVVAAGAPGEALVSPLEALNYCENDAEQQGEGNPRQQLAAGATPDAAIAPPHRDAAQQQDNRIGRRETKRGQRVRKPALIVLDREIKIREQKIAEERALGYLLFSYFYFA